MSEPTDAATTCPKCGAARTDITGRIVCVDDYVSWRCGTNFWHGCFQSRGQECRIAELTARLAEATVLLRRLLEWDHFDAAGDGAYWRKEITELLKQTAQTGADHVG